jgi:hypothetical protein
MKSDDPRQMDSFQTGHHHGIYYHLYVYWHWKWDLLVPFSGKNHGPQRTFRTLLLVYNHLVRVLPPVSPFQRPGHF